MLTLAETFHPGNYDPRQQGVSVIVTSKQVPARKVVGWQFAAHMRTGLVLDALDMALSTRSPDELDLLVHHSDRGVQYLCVRYSDRLDDNDIVASYGAAWIDDAAPVPVAWSIDLATGKSALSVLSLPAGFRGRARGIVRSPQGIVFVVGRATSPNGTDFAVAWRSTGPGSWAVTPLSAAGSDSAAHGVAIDSAGDGRSIGQRDDAQERSVPVHWTIDLATGDTTPTALPVPASVDGAAMAIAMDPSGRSVIVGTTTDASGFDRAALWRETGP